MRQARAYNKTKDVVKGTVACADCGKSIKMNGENCYSFGLYCCLPCRIRRSYEAQKPRPLGD